MYLEAVIVSINFGDFLNETLVRNRAHFDHIAVVTTGGDLESTRVAKINGADVVLTDRFDGSIDSSKGEAINEGLDRCTMQGWVCILDADIVLLPGFYNELRNAIKRDFRSLRGSTIYGVPRLMCHSYAEWMEFIRTGKHSWLPDKQRKLHQRPPGYFQLWHGKTLPSMRYPEGYGANPQLRGGVGGDLAFASQFDRCLQLKAPQVIHLDTIESGKKRDHQGRISRRWGPVAITEGADD